MRKKQHILTVILVTVCFALCLTVTDSEAMQNLHSPTHIPGVPSRFFQIEIVWDASGESEYIVRFDTTPVYTSEVLKTLGTFIINTDESFVVSPDFKEDTDPGAGYYFHIVPAAGSTAASTGPYYIDTVPPSDASVSAPEVTLIRNITLTLTYSGTDQIYVSNSGYTEGGEWEPPSESKLWELSPGTGTKTVYVRFGDSAGNTSDVSVSIKYIAGDADSSGKIEFSDAILILRALSGINTPGISSDADIRLEVVLLILAVVTGG